MANHPNRNRGASGTVPTPEEVKTARGELTQVEAAGMIYTTGVRWSNYESGHARMHPAAWELFNIKRGFQNGNVRQQKVTGGA